MPKKKPAKVGRPLKKGEKRSSFIAFKTTKTLHRALLAAAKGTLSAEIERRLEESLAGPEAYADMFGGPETMRVLHTMALAIRRAEEEAGGKSWLKDPATFEAARLMMMRYLETYRPRDEEQERAVIEGLRQRRAANLQGIPEVDHATRKRRTRT